MIRFFLFFIFTPFTYTYTLLWRSFRIENNLKPVFSWKPKRIIACHQPNDVIRLEYTKRKEENEIAPAYIKIRTLLLVFVLLRFWDHFDWCTYVRIGLGERRWRYFLYENIKKKLPSMFGSKRQVVTYMSPIGKAV